MQNFNVDPGFNGAENEGLGKRCDVAFIYPPWAVVDGRATLQNSLPPLGILSIASYLESLGYSVVVYDVHGEGLNDDDVRDARALHHICTHTTGYEP